MSRAPVPEESAPGPIASRDLLGTVFSSVISALPAFLVAALGVQIGHAMHFDAAGLGVLISIYYLAAAAASVPLSKVSMAIGSLRVMRFGCLMMGAILLILASVVQSAVWLAVVMVAAGAVSAGIQPATNLFLVRRMPRGRQGLAFGIKQAAVPASLMLGGLSVPAIALTVGWRWTFVTASAVAVCAAVLLPRPRTTLASYRARRARARLPRAARMRLIWIAVGFSIGAAAASALSSFVVSFAVAVGHDPATAGLLAGLGGLLAAVTRVGMGLWFDRHRRAPLDLVAWMLAAGAIGYLILTLSSSVLPALVVPGVVLAFTLGWGWNGLFNLAISTRYAEQAAQASGITSVGGRTGGIVGPAAFGFVAEHLSYTYAWLMTTVMAAVSAAVIFAARRGWSVTVDLQHSDE